MNIFVACAELSFRKDIHSVSLKFFEGAGVVTPSKPPPPMNNFCLYPPPVSRCFWRDPLMTPSTTPLEASFIATRWFQVALQEADLFFVEIMMKILYLLSYLVIASHLKVNQQCVCDSHLVLGLYCIVQDQDQDQSGYLNKMK